MNVVFSEKTENEKIVYQDENIDVYYFNADSPSLLLLFSEMGYRSDSASWGGTTAKAIGQSYLGFVSKKPNWFPMSSMRLARQALDSIIQNHQKIISYGHSQGGYASIKYSSMFNAGTVISFCPQFSIAPYDMEGKDYRFSSYFINSNEHQAIDAEDVSSSCGVYVFYDPNCELDKLNISHIERNIKKIHKIKVYGTGHNTIRPFAGRQTLKLLIEYASQKDVENIRLLSRKSKRAWKLRKIYLARDLARTRADLAIKIFDNEFSLLNEEVTAEFMYALQKSGKYEFLAENSNAFLGLNFLKREQYAIIIDSLNNSDQRGKAEQIENSYNFCNGLGVLHELKNESLCEVQKDSTWHDFITFGEGWHQREPWGCWGSSIRSRIYLDLTKVPAGVVTIGIPVKLFSKELQELKIWMHAANARKEISVLDDMIWLEKEFGHVVIDFHVNALLSPKMLSVNEDSRLLGVSLLASKDWVFSAEID